MPAPFRPTAPVSLARFRAIAAIPRPAAVTPGHADLQRTRSTLADAGRRLEAIVALEGRRAQERNRRSR